MYVPIYIYYIIIYVYNLYMYYMGISNTAIQSPQHRFETRNVEDSRWNRCHLGFSETWLGNLRNEGFFVEKKTSAQVKSVT